MATPYTRVPNWLLRSRMRPADKAVLLFIVSHEKDFLVSGRAIADWLGLHKNTVRGAINRLKRANIIENAGLSLHNLVGKGYRVRDSADWKWLVETEIPAAQLLENEKRKIRLEQAETNRPRRRKAA